jgi:hypothetical protein
MDSEKQRMLLQGRLAPITQSIGFIYGNYLDVSTAFITWIKGIDVYENYLTKITSHKVKGNLEQVIRTLLPLQRMSANKYIFIPMKNDWTALIDNNFRGTNTSAIVMLPRLIQSHSIWVVNSSFTSKQGALIMEIFGPEKTDWLNIVRKIRLTCDYGKWEFEQYGKPLPYEETGRYTARRIRDRFDLELLTRYLHAEGLSPFEEDFYLPNEDSSAVLIDLEFARADQNVSLDEAFRLNGIEDS